MLRLDALCDAGLAAFLLLSWDGFFEALGLPVPKPAFYAQLLGVALLALAVIEWTIAGRPGQREVAGGVAVGSGLGAPVLAVWLAAGRVVGDTRGDIILWSIAALLEAALHARTWLRGRRTSGGL